MLAFPAIVFLAALSLIHIVPSQMRWILSRKPWITPAYASLVESSSPHSFFIGMAAGTIDSTQIVIALSFHQFIEGVSLGSVFKTTQGLALSPCKTATMILLYALTSPIGIVVGWHINPSTPSDTASIIQGCFNGVSAGMLLYIALVQLLTEELSKKDTLHTKLLMYTCLLLGSGSMCALAIAL
jgi:zinc transporter 1/2/3